MYGVCDVKEDAVAVAGQEEGFEEDLSSSSPVDLNRGTCLFLNIVLRYAEMLLRRNQDSGKLLLIPSILLWLSVITPYFYYPLFCHYTEFS